MTVSKSTNWNSIDLFLFYFFSRKLWDNMKDGVIYIDAREKGFGNAFYEFLINNSQKAANAFKINVSGTSDFYYQDIICDEYLPVGDYVYGSTCIELKDESKHDFTISMQSGHLDKQMDKLYDSNFTHKELCIVGGDRDNFDLYNYNTKLKSKGIHFSWYPTEEDAIREILNTFKYTNHQFKQQTPFYKTKLNPAFNALYGIPGVSEVLSERLVTHIPLRTLEDVMNLTKQDLLEVKGIGPKLAENILKHIHN